jgi:hypothetical protein
MKGNSGLALRPFGEQLGVIEYPKVFDHAGFFADSGQVELEEGPAFRFEGSPGHEVRAERT